MVLLYYVLAALFSRPSMPFYSVLRFVLSPGLCCGYVSGNFVFRELVSGLVVPARGEVCR